VNRHLPTSTRLAVTTTAAALALAACADAEDPGDAAVPFGNDATISDDATSSSDVGSDAASSGDLAPELTLASASVRDVNLDDDREEFTEYCFASPINEVGAASAFALVGFDAAQRVQATSAVLDEDDSNCVIVGYEARTDITSYTLATVDSGGVQARDGESNVQDSVEVAGLGDAGEARRGATSAPELLRVGIDNDVDQAVYVFDENELREGSSAADAFGFYTRDGRAVTGASLVSIEDDRAVVEFDEGQLGDAARFFVRGGAVSDQQGVENILAADGGSTAAPDLVSVSATSESEYDFTFDESVEETQGSQFFLYTSEGNELTGSTVSRPSPETVRVVFSDAMEISSSIVRAAVGDGAVKGLGASATGSTIGAARVGGREADQGITSGPDLVSASIETDTGRATFTFDDVLTEDSVSADGFTLVTESGEEVTAREIVEVTGGEVTGETVIVLFDETNAQAARLATVDSGAVKDQQGSGNPLATVSVG
jgi:hypothetical protein